MKRRAGLRTPRGRRKSTRRAGGAGPRVPVPVIAIIGVFAVGALIAYVVWQQGDDAAPEHEEEAALERTPAPELPGEWVDLQEVYGALYPESSRHVRRAVDYSDQGLPPAGGPHWGDVPCPDDPDEAPRFCGPTPWGVFRKPWEPESLVHNLEHAGVVLWYNTTDQDLIAELETLIIDRGGLVVMTPYEDIDEEHIALTAWARREVFPVAEYTDDRVLDFINAFEGRFNPEDIPH